MRNHPRLFVVGAMLLMHLTDNRFVFAGLQLHGGSPVQLPPVIVHHAPAQDNPHPTGTDPLTATEIALVQRIAALSSGIEQAPPARLPKVPLLNAVQFLFAERHDGSKAESLAPPLALRRADVVYYNYATDQVIRQVVNLHTRTVEATHLRAGAENQPLVANIETQAAVQMILAHPVLSQHLQQAFLQATGQFLFRADQIQAQGIVFVPTAKLAGVCRQHRCIQLFLQVQGDAKSGMIDASNLVVDLSAGQLLWSDTPFKALVFEDETKRLASSPESERREANFECAIGEPLVITMTIGTRWGLCWAQDAIKGLVLNQISFAPKDGEMTLILGSAALAQVYVAYADGAMRQHILADNGLPLATLTTDDCPQGALLRAAAGAAVVCQRMQARGYAWRGPEQVQGQSLVLFALSRVGSESWTHQWVFDDDGAMHPMLGNSGRATANRAVTAYWRLNFDVGGSANDWVEQFDYEADSRNAITRTQTALALTRETSRTLSPEAQRFWRVKDTQLTNNTGQSISYQLVPQLSAIYRDGEAFTQSDVFVTNNKACEQFVSHNPVMGGCGAQVNDFVNNEPLDEPTSDAVIWYGTTRYQSPVKEDERASRMDWQGLTLLPRDFMSTSPLRAAMPSVPLVQARPAAASGSALNCSAQYHITQSFANTAQWQMCWEPRAGYGYRLNQITFTPPRGAPRLILNALHVALMFVPYDDGGPRYRDTSLGKQLSVLTAAECPNGVLLPGETLCLVRRARNPQQGEGFAVYGYFNVANYYYVIQFAFNDDGSIEPTVGASGSLQRYTRDATTGWPVRGLIATNHNHWVIWRMDFDLDGAADDRVQQFDVVRGAADARSLSITSLMTETKAQNDLSQSRFWRVYGDASPLALTYEIAPNVTDIYRAEEAFTQNDFYLTQNHPDEALVSDAFGVDSFVNGESVQDGVAWYGVNFHHVPRAEDDMRMPIHWQGFVLRLRDRGLVVRVFMPVMLRNP